MKIQNNYGHQEGSNYRPTLRRMTKPDTAITKEQQQAWQAVRAKRPLFQRSAGVGLDAAQQP